MLWAGHVARTREKRYAYKVPVKQKLKKRDHLEGENAKTDLNEAGGRVCATFI